MYQNVSKKECLREKFFDPRLRTFVVYISFFEKRRHAGSWKGHQEPDAILTSRVACCLDLYTQKVVAIYLEQSISPFKSPEMPLDNCYSMELTMFFTANFFLNNFSQGRRPSFLWSDFKSIKPYFWMTCYAGNWLYWAHLASCTS